MLFGPDSQAFVFTMYTIGLFFIIGPYAALLFFMGESFPTRVRGTGASFVNAMGPLGAIAGSGLLSAFLGLGMGMVAAAFLSGGLATLLQAVRGYPCVSLLMSTRPGPRMSRDDAARLERLRVHALPGFVLGHLATLLQEFQARYPQIALDIVVNDAAIDPVKEGFDCALQIFPPRSEELVSRKLFPVRRVFCATPEYVRRHGMPRHPRLASSRRSDGVQTRGCAAASSTARVSTSGASTPTPTSSARRRCGSPRASSSTARTTSRVRSRRPRCESPNREKSASRARGRRSRRCRRRRARRRCPGPRLPAA